MIDAAVNPFTAGFGVVPPVLAGRDPLPSFKQLLLSVPGVGEDAHFERRDDRGRDLKW